MKIWNLFNFLIHNLRCSSDNHKNDVASCDIDSTTPISPALTEFYWCDRIRLLEKTFIDPEPHKI
jgi:hypothetical protein